MKSIMEASSMTSFNEFVHWVQHFQQERKAPIFHPKPTKVPKSKTEDEVRRLRSILFANEEGNFGATERGYLAGVKGYAVSSEDAAQNKALERRRSKLPGSYEDFVCEMLSVFPDDSYDTLLSVLMFCPQCIKRCYMAPNCQDCGADMEQTKVPALLSPYMHLVYRSGQSRLLSDPFIMESTSPYGAVNRVTSADAGTHIVQRSNAYSTESGHHVLRGGESPPEEQAAEKAVYQCALCGQSTLDTEAHVRGCPDERIRVESVPNMFTSFIYGIESLGGKSLMLDIRYEDKEFILIDDPLNICLFHVNCIPTDVYIPDWRTLLTDPTKGLALIDRMVALSFQSLQEAWNDERWRALMSPSERDSFSSRDMQTSMIAGFALPSNERQLSLHVLCPPFTPQQYRQLLTREIFAHKQWFPLEYVCKVLTLCVRRGIQLTAEDANMPIDALIAFFDDISYDAIHTKALQRYAKVHRQLADFPIEEFEFIIGDDKIVPTQRNVPPLLPDDQEALQQHDRKIFTPSGSTRKIYGYPKMYPLRRWVDT